MSEYDISRAFKRIENDLMDSMMRNLKRHQAEETDLGIEWEQWQALQLKELERYRKQNADKFTDDFDQINRKVDAMFRATCNDSQSKQENYLLEQIKKGDFTPTQVKDTQFFNLNDAKLNILIERTKADFTRAEYAMLRNADDAYRKVIFDAQVYANVTNDYAKAVDMATHDFIMRGIDCIQYKGWTDKNGKYHQGAKHNISDYAEMCVRTGNKRAYLMGEGNAHDKYGIHTVRVNKRTQACPKCVKYLGRVLIDDVYSGGTAKEASDLGVPTLSSAIQAGFLHPNCKDIYSLYIDGVSKPAKPWTQQEINDIVGDYNQEQELKHANDMVESYARLAKYALDPENQKTYRARAQAWDKRAIEIENGTTPVPAQPQVFTDDEKEALEWYVSGDGMWINQYLRDPSAFGELNDTENQLLGLLESATEKELEPIDTLYRSVDAKVIFEGLDETEIEQMMQHLLYGDSAYDKGAYSQGIKKRMEKALSDAKGKTLTEKGFMSTTVDKKVAERFGDFTGAEHPVVIELDTKGKKIKGADVDFLDIEEDPQRERILAKNTRYKINDIVVETDADGSKYIKVKAELLDQGAEIAEDIVEDTFDIKDVDFTGFGKLIHTQLENGGCDYRAVQKLTKELTEDEIISKISGADQTKGSCVSVAWAYVANKCGLDVLDFRDGISRQIFSRSGWSFIAKLEGIVSASEATDTIRPSKKLLATMVEGKEYFYATGRHASIVRIENGEMQFLELQSGKKNGWKGFEREETFFEGTPHETKRKYNTTDTLKNRFGVSSSSGSPCIIVDIDQYKDNDQFRALMGYINTAEDAQKKGAGGGIK